jgi:hypothetical protein
MVGIELKTLRILNNLYEDNNGRNQRLLPRHGSPA